MRGSTSSPSPVSALAVTPFSTANASRLHRTLINVPGMASLQQHTALLLPYLWHLWATTTGGRLGRSSVEWHRRYFPLQRAGHHHQPRWIGATLSEGDPPVPWVDACSMSLYQCQLQPPQIKQNDARCKRAASRVLRIQLTRAMG